MPCKGDQATLTALKTALPKLLSRSLVTLQGRVIDLAFLDEILNPNPADDVLRWLADPEALQLEKAEASFAGETIDFNDAYAAEAAATLALDDVLDGRPVNRKGSRSMVATANPIASNVVGLEAEAERVALVTRIGVDCAALALDAVNTIGASNSLEVMAAHQLAVLHSTAMAYAGKASLQADPQIAVKMLNLSLRAMETFQRGMLTLKRYRATGEQKIVIERVNIEGGGQA